MFRQIGGSIGVSIFGAIFSNRLAAELGSVMPAGAGGGGARALTGGALEQLPPAMRAMVLDGFANALHPVFWTAAAAALVAFAIAWLLNEVPLRSSLRKEPEAEIAAEEAAASAVTAGPAIPQR
jgi:hypothetical protein